MATIQKNTQAHVGVASVNQTVGDWKGNTERLISVIEEARRRGVRLLLLPEMCIPGYSLGDRLLRTGTMVRSWKALGSLADHTDGIVVAVGLPVLYEGVIFNAMAMVGNGRILGLVAKENLATGDVEYENRYFQPWPHGRRVEYRARDGRTIPLGTQLFAIPGFGTVGFEICEDAWKGIRPGSTFALAGADVLCNPSASWFTIGKHRVRRRMVRQISMEDHCIYLYASLLGCDATRLVFDGSTFIAVNGRIAAEGDRFVFTEDWHLVDATVDVGEIKHKRMEEGSWREQHARMQAGTLGPMPHVIDVVGDFDTDHVAPPPPPYWRPPEPEHPDPSLEHHEEKGLGRPITHHDLSHVELELALALALRDYHRKTGIEGFTLALSGGRDSAMVALIVHRMFVHTHPDIESDALLEMIRERFTCAYMATENSGSATHDAALAIARDVGARFLDGQIQPALEACEEVVARMTGTRMTWEQPAHDIPLQNIQARLRSTLIWTVANLEQSLLLVTSNKSEAAVGYTTMDGDSSGGLAPIADVPKSLVSLWLSWAYQFHGYQALEHILELEATAELRPPSEAQTDESDLMPFYVLDQLMYAFVQLALEPAVILRRLWPAVREHYATPRAFANDIHKFVRLLCRAQWKRERFAISFRVTAFDLDPKTGFRFPAVQSPFVEELDALEALVEAVEDGRETLPDHVELPPHPDIGGGTPA